MALTKIHFKILDVFGSLSQKGLQTNQNQKANRKTKLRQMENWHLCHNGCYSMIQNCQHWKGPHSSLLPSDHLPPPQTSYTMFYRNKIQFPVANLHIFFFPNWNRPVEHLTFGQRWKKGGPAAAWWQIILLYVLFFIVLKEEYILKKTVLYNKHLNKNKAP